MLASPETRNQQSELAAVHLWQAIDADPRDERNYLDLAGIYIEHWRTQDALATTDRGLTNVSVKSRLHAMRGIVQAQMGKYDDAASEFELANSLDPTAELGAAGLGALYIERNQPAVAIKTIRERLRKDPKDATLNFLLAQALVKGGAVAGSPELVQARKSLLISLKN